VSVDILPTLEDLAGGHAANHVVPGAPPLAGRSPAPALQKAGAAPHEFLCFNHNNNRAIRVGDWKLIATGAKGPWELYDLRRERCELHNLASAQADRVQKMAALWQEQDNEYVRVREASPPTAKPRLKSAPR
jgi:arylsulfatase A-like enzyme